MGITRAVVVSLAALSIACGKTNSEKQHEAEVRAAKDYTDASKKLADLEKEIAAAEPPEPKTPWLYSETTDKMRGTPFTLARLLSTNAFAISFPRPASTQLELVVREANKKQAVFLRVTEGMLDPCVPQCTIHVKFDDGAVQAFRGLGTVDPSSSTIFVENVPRWLKQLKPAKRATIEVTLFDGGRRQFEFNVAGLEWPRTAAEGAPHRTNQPPVEAAPSKASASKGTTAGAAHRSVAGRVGTFAEPGASQPAAGRAGATESEPSTGLVDPFATKPAADRAPTQPKAGLVDPFE